jgi:hypothetical protein
MGSAFSLQPTREHGPHERLRVARYFRFDLQEPWYTRPRAGWLERPNSGTLAGVDPKRRGGYPVLLLDKDGQKRSEIKTDANGHFAFFGLPPGTWRAQVGRASILSEPVRIQRGKVSRAQFR